MWIKICGNTNVEDARLAVELGADAVGFVFAESKRQVTAAQVGAITAQLPDGVERVGVFDSLGAEEIAGVADEAGLTAVQLQGGLDEELVERLVRWNLHPADLVTHRFGLDRVADAYSLMASGKCGKVAVCFDEELE